MIMLPVKPDRLGEKRLCFRVDRADIAYLRFILEAYEGLAVMRTLDPAEGLVMFYVSRSRESELEELLAGLGRELMIEPAADPDAIGRPDPCTE